MAITVPPVDTPSKEVLPEAESPTDAGPPGVVPSSRHSQQDLSAQVKDCITQGKRCFSIVVDDVMKPSIKTFLETCDTNPRVAAIVATPALLASLLVLTFFVLSTLVLILWSFLTITIGVFFVIVGGLLSLFFKLLMVLLATVPMAGIAATLLVGANVASQFIIKKAAQLPLGRAVANTGIPRAVRETDWKQITESTVKMATQVAMGLGLHSALQTLFALQEGEITTSTSPVPQEGSLADPKVDEKYESPVLIDRELDAAAASSSTESSDGLKRRAGFSNVAGEETN